MTSSGAGAGHAAWIDGARVVHVVTSVRHGGAERVVLELARMQRALGAAPEVVCLHDLGELAPAFADAGIPVSLVPGSTKPGALSSAWQLAGWLREREPRVVHTHNAAAQVATGLGQRIRPWRQAGTVLVHTEHGRLSDTRPMFLALRRWLASEFRAIVAVSADVALQLAEYRLAPAEQLATIENGIDVARFPERGVRTRATRRELVHVGRLEMIKGQDVLIDAMPRVQESVPDVRLTIVGEGSIRLALEAQASTLGVTAVVEFIGATLDVAPWLERAEAFVLPSRSEGLSVALLEAMAAGLPVVATDVGGNRDAITTGPAGVIVPPENPGALADAIIALLRDPDRAAMLGKNARRDAAGRFGLGTTVARYLEFYA